MTDTTRSKKISIKGVHALRHTYLTRLAVSGFDMAVASKLMGHTSTCMTNRYNHITGADTIKAISNINFFGNTATTLPEPTLKYKIFAVINTMDDTQLNKLWQYLSTDK